MPTCINEPATLAAGPDSIVIAGRCRISLISITPPSPRMIISGASMPAFFMLVSVKLAVAIIRGRIDALITAVRVRVVNPYSLVTSCPHVVGRPNASPTSRTSSSVDVLSTPNALDATSTWAPSMRSALTAVSTALRSRASLSRNWLQVCSTRPGASSIGSMRTCPSASFAAFAAASPRIPTRATSPSSSALVACVVLCASRTTSLASMPASPSTRSNTWMTPAATPSGWSWVV